MTATTLNQEFAGIIDTILEQVDTFAKLRDNASDEEWSDASEQAPLADYLSDLEYDLELFVKKLAGALTSV